MIRHIAKEANSLGKAIKRTLETPSHQWAAMIVADTVDPPRPGGGKALRCFGDTAAEAKAVALRYLGRCTERN